MVLLCDLEPMCNSTNITSSNTVDFGWKALSVFDLQFNEKSFERKSQPLSTAQVYRTALKPTQFNNELQQAGSVKDPVRSLDLVWCSTCFNI